MGYVKRKTACKEHETPRRVRFRHLIEQGYSQSHAAEELGLPRTTAMKWVQKRASDRRTGKRPGRSPIISDEKIEEMVQWIIGHFDR